MSIPVNFKKSETLRHIVENLVVPFGDGEPIDFPFKIQVFCLENDRKLDKLNQIRDVVSMMKIKYNWGVGTESLDKILEIIDGKA